MTSIVGQSRDHSQSQQVIMNIGEIGRAIQQSANQLKNHEDRLSNLEDNMRVNGIQERNLTDNVNYVIVKFLGGKSSNAYKSKSIRGKAYSQINKEIKKKFGIPRRGELPAKEYDQAIEYIKHWMPDKDLADEIEHSNDQLKLMSES